MFVSKDVCGLTCNVYCRKLAATGPWSVSGVMTAKDFKNTGSNAFRDILCIAMCAAGDSIVLEEDKKRFTKRRLLALLQQSSVGVLGPC